MFAGGAMVAEALAHDNDRWPTLGALARDKDC
jgi:hypothetical protein